ncbi:DUF6065 family protein [Ancylobacter sp. FA202]|uniref:DUF6065 family protein n=1 Tax=Ancylobacter sp. FA202 TaxID=1111106 RepID=UPI0004AEC09C|nr:DUF6065 family protein [Ancylobacter sp. FA202]
MTSLTSYRLRTDAPALVPARAERAWMDATSQRFAYRCLPLSIANSMGWELLCPITFEAEWDGRDGLDAIAISADSMDIEFHAASHFGFGVLTMFTHYLFRTEPGIGMSVRGCPNLPKDGIHALEGLVETDWLDFPFTMNWKFTRPGTVRFEKDEPFCFLAPVPYRALEAVRPKIVPIEMAADRQEAVRQYGELRGAFNALLNSGDPEAMRQGWQKWYFRGVHPDGKPGNPLHVSKLRLAEPLMVEMPASETAPPRSNANDIPTDDSPAEPC